MAKRAVTPGGQQLIDLVVGTRKARAKALGEDIRGDSRRRAIMGRLTTDEEEKSLGCMHKAGHAPLRGVLEYADSPTHLACGYGYLGRDIESISGMVAGWAQIVILLPVAGAPAGN